MRALTIADSAAMILGLQDEIRRSEESRYDHRLHGVLLVAQGMTCPEVARLLGDAPRSVEYWVRGFEAKGLAGLEEGGLRGCGWSVGCGVMKKGVGREGRKGNEPAGPDAWMRSNSGRSIAPFAVCRAIWGWAELCGTARPWRPGLPSGMRLTWG